MSDTRRVASSTTRNMLMCRTIGHAWYPYDAQRRAREGYLWVLRCERCNTQRDDIVDFNGYLSSRNYQHPEGYRDAHLLYESQADRRAALLSEEDVDDRPQPRATRNGPRRRARSARAAS